MAIGGHSSKSLPTHWIAWKLGSSLHLVLLPSASPVFLLPQSTAVRPLEVPVAPPCRPPDWAHGCKAPLESLEVGLTRQFAVETCVVHWKKTMVSVGFWMFFCEMIAEPCETMMFQNKDGQMEESSHCVGLKINLYIWYIPGGFF